MMNKHFKGWRSFLAEVNTNDWAGDDWGEMAKRAVRKPTPRNRDTVGHADPNIVQELLNTYGMNSTQNHNFKMMANTERLREIVIEKGSIADAARKLGSLTHQIALMTKENKIFSETKMLEFLGAGNFGAVFTLDNGHVLKISYGSFDPEFRATDYGGHTDAKKHEKAQAETFKDKSASKSTLMIYDYGTLQFSNTAEDLYYVEMPELIPLAKYFRHMDRLSVYNDVAYVKIAVLERLFPPNQPYGNPYKVKVLNRGQVTSLVKELVKIIKASGAKGYEAGSNAVEDVRAPNVGVLIQDPDTLVIFDY